VIVIRDLLRRGFARAAGWPYYFVLPKAGIETVKGYFAEEVGDRIVTGRYYASRHTWGRPGRLRSSMLSKVGCQPAPDVAELRDLVGRLVSAQERLNAVIENEVR
jgi:hypothetical protein